MIEISHAQARWLIRLEMDRPVPEEQWNALQAHLEGCPDCRAYRRQCSALEKGLRRGLQAHWSAVKIDLRPLADEILNDRRRRAAHRRDLGYAGLAVLLPLMLIGLLLYIRTRQPSTSPPAARASTAAAAVTAAPSPTVGPQFHGVAAFSALADGVSHIFLLEASQSGKELTDLTPGPARATDPVWSPDGQWIAFLSDRDREGKTRGFDIYVINLAGTRLTRLTADPGFDWSGPLSWSPDGHYIAAVGTHQDRPGSWIYLVSWDGRPIRMVPQTQNARLPSFSPQGRRLAYQAPTAGGNGGPPSSELRIYDEMNGQTVKITGGDPDFPIQLGDNARFTWSPDGNALLYVDHNWLPDPNFPVGMSEVRVASGLDYALSSFGPGAKGVVPSAALLTYSAEQDALAATWTPSGRVLLLEPIESSGSPSDSAALSVLEGLTSVLGPRRNLDPLNSPALRVLGGLSGQNEQAGWLVLAARLPDEPTAGIYALNMPDRAEPTRVTQIVRLLDLPAGAGEIKARPVGPVLAIHPVAARPPSTTGAPAVASTELLSRVWVALPGNAGVAHLNPTGDGVVQPNPHPGFCPRVSPDGRRVAFVAWRPGDTARSDIYVMDTDGQNLRQLTRLPIIPDSANPVFRQAFRSRYDCPTWSPDSSRLAAWMETDERESLAVLSVDAAEAGTDPQARYFPLLSTSPRPAPQWSSDSQHVVVSLQTNNYYEPEIVSLDVQSGEKSRLQRSDGWYTSVGSLALSGEPGWLAFTAMRLTAGFGLETDLYVLGQREGPVIRTFNLADLSPWAANIPAGPLVWRSASVNSTQPRAASSIAPGPGRLAGLVSFRKPGYIGFSLLAGPDAFDRTTFMVYDLERQRLLPLISLQEEVRASAWSPDGQWVIYTTESGLWCLNVPGALAGQSFPAWLGSEQVEDLDWH